jgi:2-polyprenyl-6-methoxyphenol hydroxylase-like FAD-dependent oxidoreductase
MYPTGSNGASQAIVDARVLGAAFLAHGVGREALRAYESTLLTEMSALVIRNRETGPFSVLGLVDERCGGVFDHVDDVVSQDEIAAIRADYREAAGLAVDAVNDAPRRVDVNSRG